MDSSDQAAPRAESPSLGDRIANIFGPEAKQAPPPPNKPEPQDAAPVATDETVEPDVAASEDAAPDAGPSETAPQFEEVEWDGDRFQVPPKLKEAISKASDYTKKTQEVADQRRLVEYQANALKIAESERKFAETVRDEISQLSQMDQQLKQYSTIDWASLSTDEAFRYKLQQDQLKEKRDTLDRELGRKHGEFQEHVRRSHSELIQQGMETLKKSIPNFGTETVKAIKDYANSRGLSAAEIDNIIDPRMVLILNDAAQYQKLQASRSATKAVIQQAKPIGKASPTNPMPSSVKDQLNYRKALERAGPRGSQARQALAKDRVAAIFGK